MPNYERKRGYSPLEANLSLLGTRCNSQTSAERSRLKYHSQGQILALAFLSKSSTKVSVVHFSLARRWLSELLISALASTAHRNGPLPTAPARLTSADMHGPLGERLVFMPTRPDAMHAPPTEADLSGSKIGYLAHKEVQDPTVGIYALTVILGMVCWLLTSQVPRHG